MNERSTPVTDAFREIVIQQYKENELTGDGMGNILHALTDIEILKRERDELKEQLDTAMMLIRLQKRREQQTNEQP